MTTPTFRDSVRGLLHDRLLDAAQEMTVNNGWATITMGKIAASAGVSRQTVYNEFGNKQDLAEALVVRELAKFLDVVSTRLRSHEDVVAGLVSACEGALSFAEDNPLLKAALASVHSGSNELIPLLTTESQLVIDAAVAAVVGTVNEHYGPIGLTQDELIVAVDVIVRLILSHIMRPAETPAQVAEHIGWIASKLLQQ